MLFRNRHGLLFSRPWRSFSKRPHAKLVTLLQAYPRCHSKMDAQVQAYYAGPRIGPRMAA